MADRLAELRGRDVPHASLALIDAREPDKMPWAEQVPEQLHEVLDRYLSQFAWIEEGGAMICPGCDTRGVFAWGLVHGSGNCSICGWPGTVSHLLLDPSDEAECERCGRRKPDHVPQTVDVSTVVAEAMGVESVVRRELRCPESKSVFDTFKQPLLLKFDVLLWVHPSEVQPPKGDA
jgi:hypothetical protein